MKSAMRAVLHGLSVLCVLGAWGILGFAPSASAAPALRQAAESGFLEDFQSVQVAEDGGLTSAIGRFVVEGEGALEIVHPTPWQDGELGLRLPGGTEKSTVMEVAPSCAFGGTLEFTCQRDGRKRPFAFGISLIGRDGVEVIRDLTGQINAKALQAVSIEVPSGVTQIRFNVTAPLTRGVWMDDLRFVPPAPMRLESARFNLHTRPLIHGESVEVGVLEMVTAGGLNPLAITQPMLVEHTAWRGEGSVDAKEEASEDSSKSVEPKSSTLLSGFAIGDQGTEAAEVVLVSGINRIPVFATADLWKTEADVAAWSASSRFVASFTIGEEPLTVGAETMGSAPASWPAVRLMPASAEIDGVSLVTALAKGDRPEVLVAAISTTTGVVIKRSVDGGSRWSDGQLTGDAATLREASLVFDIGRDKLHLIAERERAMFHAFSTDQGATWSELTLLEGLGETRIGGAASSGVYMSTTELAVPCIYYGGFRIADEPCAGILASRDGGKTWEAHKAAFANTSTSAVVEVGPGALLLNMTDGRGAKRSERTTRDLGESWVRRNRVSMENLHLSAGSDGALIHLGRARAKGWDGRLVFANASTERLPVRNMTLKGCSDNASSWPVENRILLDDGKDVDHPSLAPVGASEVGVAYSPSCGGVIFQRLPESVVVPQVASWFDVTGGR